MSAFQTEVQNKLRISRETFQHGPTKGDASEHTWLEVLDRYLPKRYAVGKVHVVDAEGTFSEQIDVAVFDRQYTPFILHFEGQKIVPAESVYAVFEAKQTLNAENIKAAQRKAATVRRLERTSGQITNAGVVQPPRKQFEIIAGVLTLDSDWIPALGTPLLYALEAGGNEFLNLGCAAAEGYFTHDSSQYELKSVPNAASSFLFELIAKLQACGTVPAIDIGAYAKWLA